MHFISIMFSILNGIRYSRWLRTLVGWFVLDRFVTRKQAHMVKMDFERLITEIEKRPTIWDPRDQKHCNRVFVSKCWWDIGNVLILEGFTNKTQTPILSNFSNDIPLAWQLSFWTHRPFVSRGRLVWVL